MTLRMAPDDDTAGVLLALSAAVAVETQVTLSIEPAADPQHKSLVESMADFVPGWIHPVEETDSELEQRINEGQVDRLRLLRPGATADSVIQACANAFVTIVSDPVLRDGRVECLRYLDEQSISNDYHRYGNLGRRADETRRPVL